MTGQFARELHTCSYFLKRPALRRLVKAHISLGEALDANMDVHNPGELRRRCDELIDAILPREDEIKQERRQDIELLQRALDGSERLKAENDRMKRLLGRLN